MKIAIDARCLTTPPTGIGHYLLAAVNVWAALAPDVQFVLMAHRPLHPDAAALLTRVGNVEWVQASMSLYRRNGLWWLIAGFASHAKRLGATHLWGACGLLPPWRTFGLSTILTVHDLVFKSMPWTMSAKSRFAYGVLAGRSLLQADHVWSVSHFTLREINRHYVCPVSQTRVVGSGLNPLRKALSSVSETDASVVLNKYGVTSRTLLFVGTLEPRKNLEHITLFGGR
jgi:glycosyltransferase involved in cell wall biosynthesis